MNDSDYAKCSHCGTCFEYDDSQPCHICGETEKVKCIVLIDTLELEDENACKAISGKTNRPTIHADSRNPTGTVEIQKHIISYVENETNDLSLYIEPLVKKFNNDLDLENHIFFRGVYISVKEYLPPSKQIGPSPKPNDGRYNVQGEKCIYLTDSIDSIYSELHSSSILVQKFDIPMDTLKIADLSPNNTSLPNSLALAFDMAENGRTSSGYDFENKLMEKHGKESKRYLVSQLLSSLFKKYKWDGIYIPGVHGKQEHHYHNLVIFGTKVDEWETWAKGQYFHRTRKLS